MMNNIPKIKFDIDSENPLSGVKAVSLVDEPAIESDFVFFNKEKNNSSFIQLEKDDYKQIVFGLALIPNKYIYRKDDSGNEYYGWFTSEAIAKIRDKFHKELLTNRVNTDHNSENFIDAYLLESYIIDNDHRLEDVKSRGITKASLGSWVFAYKIEDKETFNKVVKGELRGFSIEAFLQQLHKQENNLKNEFEKTMDNILKKFKALLAEMESKESNEKFERAKTESGTEIEYGAEGEPVNIITINEDGSESTDVAPDETYVLDNGVTIVVESGVATSISEAEPVEEEAEKNDKDESLSKSVYASYTTSDGQQLDVSISEVNSVFISDMEGNYKPATDGTYTLEDGSSLLVKDGKFVEIQAIQSDSTEEVVENRSEEELRATKAEKEKLAKELEAVKTELEKLKKAPVVKPVSMKDVKLENQVDISKLTGLEKIKAKHGLLN